MRKSTTTSSSASRPAIATAAEQMLSFFLGLDAGLAAEPGTTASEGATVAKGDALLAAALARRDGGVSADEGDAVQAKKAAGAISKGPSVSAWWTGYHLGQGEAARALLRTESGAVLIPDLVGRLTARLGISAEVAMEGMEAGIRDLTGIDLDGDAEELVDDESFVDDLLDL